MVFPRQKLYLINLIPRTSSKSCICGLSIMRAVQKAISKKFQYNPLCQQFHKFQSIHIINICKAPLPWNLKKNSKCKLTPPQSTILHIVIHLQFFIITSTKNHNLNRMFNDRLLIVFKIQCNCWTVCLLCWQTIKICQ